MLAIPSPPTHPFFGNLLHGRREGLGLYIRCMLNHGDVVRIHAPGSHIVALFHPDFVRRVLQENNKNYPKDTPMARKMRIGFGNGLVTSLGEEWRKNRRIAQPAFHREKIAGFAKLMVDATEQLLQRWESFAKAGQPIDASTELTRVALQIVGETLLGAAMVKHSTAVSGAVERLSEAASKWLVSIVDIPMKIPTPRNRQILADIETLRSIVRNTVAERRAQKETKADLLGMLMEATDEETGAQMSDQQLHDEVLTMFLAGHETVANSMAWTVYLLSRHPDVRREVQKEVHEVLGTRVPQVADLRRLQLLERVLKEALRLYPPISHISRLALEDDVMGGYTIPKNTIVVVSPYAVHRHPRYWKNPEAFDPSRFLPEAEAERPKFAYFPFGGGPRLCIGNTFSIFEMQIVLSMITQKFELDLVPGHPVEPAPFFALRARYGLLMNLRKRHETV